MTARSTVKPPAFVYLASASPRRRELLDRLQVAHRPLLGDDDEDVEALEAVKAGDSPRAYVRRVARLKAEAALDRLHRRALEPAPILVGDTTVALGRVILGKPVDAAEARRMLADLAGRTHRVLTAITVIDATRSACALSESRVRMRAIDDRELDAYVASGEPFGKAGGYAIQGRAAAFIEHIAGSHSGIVGLPLFETAALLGGFGIDIV